MNHDDYLILCGLDDLEAQLEADLRALDERDRLEEFAPASALPSAVTGRSDPAPVTPMRGRRQPEEPAEHRRVRCQLYGRRSGMVDNVVPLRPSQSFNYVESDIPAGVSLADWRARKNATSGDDAPEAA